MNYLIRYEFNIILDHLIWIKTAFPNVTPHILIAAMWNFTKPQNGYQIENVKSFALRKTDYIKSGICCTHRNILRALTDWLPMLVTAVFCVTAKPSRLGLVGSGIPVFWAAHTTAVKKVFPKILVQSWLARYFQEGLKQRSTMEISKGFCVV